MKILVDLPTSAIKNALNSDKEFRLSARYWYCDLRFGVGEDFYYMTIKDGEVATFVKGSDGFDPYTINFSAPEDFWLETLQIKPKPFYHDWFAASMHHALDFGGDLESAYAYYYSIRRIHYCMATCFNAQKIAA